MYAFLSYLAFALSYLLNKSADSNFFKAFFEFQSDFVAGFSKSKPPSTPGRRMRYLLTPPLGHRKLKGKFAGIRIPPSCPPANKISIYFLVPKNFRLRRAKFTPFFAFGAGQIYLFFSPVQMFQNHQIEYQSKE